jgi:uncharacterized integral membrane protein
MGRLVKQVFIFGRVPSGVPAPCGGGDGREFVMVQRGPGNGAGASGGRLGGGAIASLIGAGVLVIFMVQNTEDVTLTFLFWSFTWPMWLFTLVTALVGAMVWFGLGVIRRHRRRRARRD